MKIYIVCLCCEQFCSVIVNVEWEGCTSNSHKHCVLCGVPFQSWFVCGLYVDCMWTIHQFNQFVCLYFGRYKLHVFESNLFSHPQI